MAVHEEDVGLVLVPRPDPPVGEAVQGRRPGQQPVTISPHQQPDDGLANPFTVADPEDAGMLDVVGFDTTTPAIMADFARG